MASRNQKAKPARRTYTLDTKLTGDITITEDDGKKQKVHIHTLSTLQSLSGVPYTERDDVIIDQKILNYLDAIKDGTNVYQLDALDIYFKSGERDMQ